MAAVHVEENHSFRGTRRKSRRFLVLNVSVRDPTLKADERILPVPSPDQEKMVRITGQIKVKSNKLQKHESHMGPSA